MLQSLSNKDGRTETLSGELNELTLINAIDMLPERSMLWNKSKFNNYTQKSGLMKQFKLKVSLKQI